MSRQPPAFTTVYTKIEQITKATCSLKAQGVANEEMATIDGRPAQVVKIQGGLVTLQVRGPVPTIYSIRRNCSINPT